MSTSQNEGDESESPALDPLPITPGTCPPMLKAMLVKSCRARANSTGGALIIYQWDSEKGLLLLRMFLRRFICDRHPRMPPTRQQRAVNMLASPTVLDGIVSDALLNYETLSTSSGDLTHAFWAFRTHVLANQEDPFVASNGMFLKLDSLLGNLLTSTDTSSPVNSGSSPATTIIYRLAQRQQSIENRPKGSSLVHLASPSHLPALFGSVPDGPTWITSREKAYYVDLGHDGQSLLAKLIASELADGPDETFYKNCVKTLESEETSRLVLRAIGFLPNAAPADALSPVDHLHMLLGMSYLITGTLDSWEPLFHSLATLLKRFNEVQKSLDVTPITAADPAVAGPSTGTSEPSQRIETAPNTPTPAPPPNAASSPLLLQNAVSSAMAGPSNPAQAPVVPIRATQPPPTVQGKGNEKEKVSASDPGPSQKLYSEAEVVRFIEDAIKTAPINQARHAMAPSYISSNTPSSSSAATRSAYLQTTGLGLRIGPQHPANTSAQTNSIMSVNVNPATAATLDTRRDGRHNSQQAGPSSILQGAKQAVAGVLSAPIRKRKATSSPQVPQEHWQSPLSLPLTPSTSQAQNTWHPPGFSFRFINTLRPFRRGGGPSNERTHNRSSNNKKP